MEHVSLINQLRQKMSKYPKGYSIDTIRLEYSFRTNELRYIKVRVLNDRGHYYSTLSFDVSKVDKNEIMECIIHIYEEKLWPKNQN